MFHIVLYEPEIPPNTGNIIRLAANTNCQLHLIEPLGFELEHKRLRRAGLDYQEWAEIRRYKDFVSFKNTCKFNHMYAFSTKARTCYTTARYASEDALLFGPETRGLPDDIMESLGSDNCLRIPMVASSRSLNLSNTVAIAVYEVWRQTGFSLS
ncbi:MAG: tRNA (cytidine(34)-2'-O)-methyltransferase [Gammaproteobacteria bacterium]|nr:tRNA (cytidine(34)-2'-O)-methyltransferase [Gammaproteobacteria bacterium]